MNILSDVIANRCLMAPLTAWIIAQLLKVPFSFTRAQGFDFRRLVSSGGMPSAHSALVTSLSTITGLSSGWGSDVFAISVVVSMIVMYDAAGVRQAAGRQAKILNEMAAEWQASKRFSDVRLRELLGHTPIEVFVGALLGIGTALLFFHS